LLFGFGAALAQVLQGVFQARDLAKPCALLGLGEPLGRVSGHLLDARQLSGIDS
jgi:hypothetical protein